MSGVGALVRSLPFGDLQAATDDFNARGRIGGGGSCVVYEAVLFGLPVAVKVGRTLLELGLTYAAYLPTFPPACPSHAKVGRQWLRTHSTTLNGFHLPT